MEGVEKCDHVVVKRLVGDPLNTLLQIFISFVPGVGLEMEENVKEKADKHATGEPPAVAQAHPPTLRVRTPTGLASVAAPAAAAPITPEPAPQLAHLVYSQVPVARTSPHLTNVTKESRFKPMELRIKIADLFTPFKPVKLKSSPAA